MKLDLLLGDCLDVLPTLEAGSVHCCVTSPPYWGLRDYDTATWEGGNEGCDHKAPPTGGRTKGATLDGTSNRGGFSADGQYPHTCTKCGARRIDSQLGLEATPEEYVAKMVEVFRAVKRVLRDDGTLWLNIGDSYACSPAGNKIAKREIGNAVMRQDTADALLSGARKDKSKLLGIKPKDLCGIPWMVAFALRADGWYLRSDIIWAKKNAMPESCTDRPTKSHEYLFLLTKSARYYYDADAVREPQSGPIQTHTVGQRNDTDHNGQSGRMVSDNGSRNKRSVWTISTQPYAKAHFATFPEALVLPCILAGTSEEGCCAECGAPWERVVEKTGRMIQQQNGPGKATAHVEANGPHGVTSSLTTGFVPEKETTGWQPTCTCGQALADKVATVCMKGEGKLYPAPVPCTVLDPFLGSGTTAKVAQQYGRSFVGCELSAEYLELARDRFKQSRLFA